MEIFDYFSARVPFFKGILSNSEYYAKVNLSATLMAGGEYYGNLIKAYIFKHWQQINFTKSFNQIDKSKGLAYIALEADSFLLWIQRFTLFSLSNDEFCEIFNPFQKELNYFKFSSFKTTRWLEDVEAQRSRLQYLKNVELLSLASILTFRNALPEDFDTWLIRLKLQRYIFRVSKTHSVCTREDYRIISLLIYEGSDLGLLNKTISYQDDSINQFQKCLFEAIYKFLLTPSNRPFSLQIFTWLLKCFIFLNFEEISEK